jgi:hypothetical protein
MSVRQWASADGWTLTLTSASRQAGSFRSWPEYRLHGVACTVPQAQEIVAWREACTCGGIAACVVLNDIRVTEEEALMLINGTDVMTLLLHGSTTPAVPAVPARLRARKLTMAELGAR